MGPLDTYINRHPIQIPAGSEMLVWGRTKSGVNGKDYECLVKPLEVGEVLIAQTLSTIHGVRVLKRVQNLNDSPMYLYRHQKLAKTCIIDPADALSRFPPDAATLDAEEEREGVEIPLLTHVRAHVARAMCVGAGKANQENSPNATLGVPLYPERTPPQWSSLQGEDPTLRRVSWYLQRGHRPNKQERRQESKLVLRILQHWERLSLIGGVLCRTLRDPKEVDPVIQLLVPEGEQHSVWQLYHECAGH